MRSPAFSSKPDIISNGLSAEVLWRGGSVAEVSINCLGEVLLQFETHIPNIGGRYVRFEMKLSVCWC